jgi:hypothetical protein
MRRLLAMMTTGLALTTAYVVYSGLVSPIVRLPERSPEPAVTSEPANTLRPVENVRVASTWLAEEPWTEEAKYQLRTDEMFVYANEWKPKGEEGQIEFRPFAAVWLSENKDGVPQAVTVTAESALLKFQSAFELDHPNPGRVIGGSLFGTVRITGPDGLEILGENFFFVEGTSSLYSNSEVKCRFGRNHGEAGALTVRLVQADTPASKDRPNIVGIEAVELRQGVRMQLELDQKRPEEGPVFVRCAGRFVYRVEERSATYEDSVIAWRRVGKPKQLEEMRCDRLTVFFEPKENSLAEKRPEPQKTSDRNSREEFRTPESDLEFRKLVAEGRPEQNGAAAIPVRLQSKARRLRAWMQRLTYDAGARTITMQSPDDVKVEQERNRLVCPEVEVVLNQDGKSIAEAVCRGAGMIFRNSPTGELVFAADWVKQLRKTTDPETNLDLIELEQYATFRQHERDTGLCAELIRLWFVPPKSDGAEAQLPLLDESSWATPKRLLALKEVAFLNPKVEFDGEQLEVVFSEESTDEEPPTPRGRKKRDGKRPANPQAPRGAVTESDDVADDGPPLSVTAEKMRVRILPVTAPEQQPQLAEIWSAGKVRVVQPSDAGGLPIVVTGERLHVKNNSEDDQVVHVYGEPGRPAQVRDEQQQVHLEGQAIGMDRAENLAWVEGAGLLRLPVPKTLDGQELPVPQMLDVWWKEGMDFDGVLASFEGDVRAKLEGGTMLCRTMQVEFTRPVSFGDPRSGGAQPEVKTVTCRDNVELENHRLEEKKLVEIQRAKVWEFHLDNVTGETIAKGPGWMQRWKRGNARLLGDSDKVQANSVSREPAPQWEYTRVDFAGDMKGNVVRKTTSFHDRVEVLYGPVERPVDIIKRHQLPQNGGFMECETLEFVQVSPPGAAESFVQLRGTGDTRLEGQGYEGRADQISYDQTKGQFVLRSFGSYQATIWRETAGRTDPTRTDAQQMEFFPAKGQLKVVNSTGAQAAQ